MSCGGPPRKRNFKIEAFKHRVELDPKYAERTWKVLEHAIHEIYNHNASGLSFEELYRSVLQPSPPYPP
jgi:cullin 3